MSKKIQLTQGKYAIVDDEDFEYLNQWKWYCHKCPSGICYATANIKIDGNYTSFRMHRLIMKVYDKKVFIDHIDHDGLNNQKSNLRESTQSENQRNRGKQRNNTSGFKGVFWNKKAKKWIPAIRINGKMIALGCFDCKIKAAEAYNFAAIEYHGEFAHLNQIPK